MDFLIRRNFERTSLTTLEVALALSQTLVALKMQRIVGASNDIQEIKVLTSMMEEINGRIKTLRESVVEFNQRSGLTEVKQGKKICRRPPPEEAIQDQNKKGQIIDQQFSDKQWIISKLKVMCLCKFRVNVPLDIVLYQLYLENRTVKIEGHQNRQVLLERMYLNDQIPNIFDYLQHHRCFSFDFYVLLYKHPKIRPKVMSHIEELVPDLRIINIHQYDTKIPEYHYVNSTIQWINQIRIYSLKYLQDLLDGGCYWVYRVWQIARLFRRIYPDLIKPFDTLKYNISRDRGEVFNIYGSYSDGTLLKNILLGIRAFYREKIYMIHSRDDQVYFEETQVKFSKTQFCFVKNLPMQDQCIQWMKDNMMGGVYASRERKSKKFLLKKLIFLISDQKITFEDEFLNQNIKFIEFNEERFKEFDFKFIAEFAQVFMHDSQKLRSDTRQARLGLLIWSFILNKDVICKHEKEFAKYTEILYSIKRSPFLIQTTTS